MNITGQTTLIKMASMCTEIQCHTTPFCYWFGAHTWIYRCVEMPRTLPIMTLQACTTVYTIHQVGCTSGRSSLVQSCLDIWWNTRYALDPSNLQFWFSSKCNCTVSKHFVMQLKQEPSGALILDKECASRLGLQNVSKSDFNAISALVTCKPVFVTEATLSMLNIPIIEKSDKV